MKLQIQKATRTQRKARICLAGASGSGKTMTALRVARGLVGDAGKILVLDTERGSASLYADVTDYDVAELPDYFYDTYISAIKEAGKLGYEALIVDSLSHAWQEFLDQHSKMQGNSYVNWSKITPKYNELIQAVVNYSGHIIVTMRAKTKYEMDDKNRPVRQYMGTIMRDGTEYEFDLVGMISIDHNMQIEKSRIQHLQDRIITKPDESFGQEVAEWLGNAAPRQVVTPAKPKASVQEQFKALVNSQRFKSEEEIQALPFIYSFPDNATQEEKLELFRDAYDLGGCYSIAQRKIYADVVVPSLEHPNIQMEEIETIEMMEARND